MEGLYWPEVRQIRLIECNATMSLSKKLTCEGTLCKVFYLPEAPSPPMTPSSPLTPCVPVNSTVHLFPPGRKGGRGES